MVSKKHYATNTSMLCVNPYYQYFSLYSRSNSVRMFKSVIFGFLCMRLRTLFSSLGKMASRSLSISSCNCSRDTALVPWLVGSAVTLRMCVRGCLGEAESSKVDRQWNRKNKGGWNYEKSHLTLHCIFCILPADDPNKRWTDRESSDTILFWKWQKITITKQNRQIERNIIV